MAGLLSMWWGPAFRVVPRWMRDGGWGRTRWGRMVSEVVR